MKQKVLSEIKNKDIQELRKMLEEARKELFQLQLDHAQFKLKNTRSIFHKRKEIAIIQTILKEKEAYGKNT